MGWNAVRQDMQALADDHRSHAVSHPGWSFPARVWSAPASADLPAERRVRHAELRGYRAVCPALEPGTVCRAQMQAVPRVGSDFEPVLLGRIVGPDAEIRTHLPLVQAPKHLLDAIRIAEDERFYSHFGVDPIGTLRATLVNLRGGGVRQGASTLTMQVVRGLGGRRDRTFGRKTEEMARAIALDQAFGKDGVMQVYLDMPYLGQDGPLSICGFEEASRYYWGRPATEMTLAQAATLASILPGPARWAPDKFPEIARERRDGLLRRMGEAGWDVDAALQEPMDASPHPVDLGERAAPYLAAVRNELLARLPAEAVYGAGLNVVTRMDLVAQEDGAALVAERLRFLESAIGRRGPEPLRAAGVLLDPVDGALVAVVDSGMAASTDFLRPMMARRQPGSSFKPVVSALALQKRDASGHYAFTAASVWPNTPRAFAEGWVPRNVGGHYTPTATLADGLASSHNIVSVGLMEASGGPTALRDFAGVLGFDVSRFPVEPGLALGQAEVTIAEMGRFATVVATGGRQVEGSTVAGVVDAAGRERLSPAALGPAVMDVETTAVVRELMRLVVTQGTGGGARGRAGFGGYDGPLFGKTGTSDDEKDLWFVGGSGAYAGALWLGYDEPTRVGAAASDFAAPMFGWWFREVHEGLPRQPLSEPALDFAWVCSQTGRHASGECRGLRVPFRPGTAPAGLCDGLHGPEPWTLGDHKSLWDELAEGQVAEPSADPTE